MLNTYVRVTSLIDSARAHLRRLRDDESGASLIEYSLLIGLITVATVTTIGLVGPKIAKAWTDLNAAMP